MQSPRVDIIRLENKEFYPTRGVILINSSIHGTTLERPWANNAPSVSCIPTGEYFCKLVYNRFLHNGVKLPCTYEVTSVPNRKGILFHTGNFEKDTEGCILIGQGFGEIDNKIAILNSKVAFDSFLEKIGSAESFTLVIRKLGTPSS